MIKSFISRPSPEEATDLAYKEIQDMEQHNYKVKQISRSICNHYGPSKETGELHFAFTIWFEKILTNS